MYISALQKKKTLLNKEGNRFMIHKDTVTSPRFRAYAFNPSVKVSGTWLYLIKYFKCKSYIYLI